MKIEIDGIKINYIDEGVGNAVLLLHGWGANIQTMLPIFNMLKNKCRVIAVDLPGFGESDEPNEPINSFYYANIVKRLLDILEIKKVILIGHSHGGRISIIMASHYQELVEKIVLIDSAGIKPKRKPKYFVKIFSYKIIKYIYNNFIPKKAREKKLNNLYKKYGSVDYKNTTGVMRKTIVNVLKDNIDNLLQLIKIPTLIVWGDKDLDTPLYMANRLKKNIEDSGLIVLKNAGHFSYIDDFVTFKAVINSFLKDNYCIINSSHKFK